MLTYRLTGEVDAPTLAHFLAELSGAPERSEVVVRLDDADVEDAVCVAVLSDGLRQASRRCAKVTVWRAPQLVAHTLYRVGALQGSRLELVEPRDELGTAS